MNCQYAHLCLFTLAWNDVLMDMVYPVGLVFWRKVQHPHLLRHWMYGGVGEESMEDVEIM